MTDNERQMLRGKANWKQGQKESRVFPPFYSWTRSATETHVNADLQYTAYVTNMNAKVRMNHTITRVVVNTIITDLTDLVHFVPCRELIPLPTRHRVDEPSIVATQQQYIYIYMYVLCFAHTKLTQPNQRRVVCVCFFSFCVRRYRAIHITRI